MLHTHNLPKGYCGTENLFIKPTFTKISRLGDNRWDHKSLKPTEVKVF